MIPYRTNALKPVRVGYWHIEPARYGTVTKPRTKELRFDKPEVCYEGNLIGFLVEGEINEGLVACALVEKPDGTFDTPSVSVVQLIKA